VIYLDLIRYRLFFNEFLLCVDTWDAIDKPTLESQISELEEKYRKILGHGNKLIVASHSSETLPCKSITTSLT